MNRFKSRSGIAAALLTLLIVAAASAAIAIGDEGGAEIVPDKGVAGSDNLTVSTTDKTGKQWGVMEYASADDGDRCLYAGVVNDGEVGEISKNGDFIAHELKDAPGSCGDFDSGALVARGVVDEKGVTQQTLFFGTLEEGKASVRLTLPNGAINQPTLGDKETFLAVFPGEVDPSKVKVVYSGSASR